jgi:hypothetical protein
MTILWKVRPSVMSVIYRRSCNDCDVYDCDVRDIQGSLDDYDVFDVPDDYDVYDVQNGLLAAMAVISLISRTSLIPVILIGHIYTKNPTLRPFPITFYDARSRIGKALKGLT